MIEHGVCAAMSSGEYKCSVRPFLVKTVFEAPPLSIPNWPKDDW